MLHRPIVNVVTRCFNLTNNNHSRFHTLAQVLYSV